MQPLPDEPAPLSSTAQHESPPTSLSNTGPQTEHPNPESPEAETDPSPTAGPTQEGQDQDDGYGFGLDTVKLSIPVDLAMSDASSSFWQHTSSRNLRDSMPEAECLTGFYEMAGGPVRVSLYTARSRCTLHFNAARLADPSSRTSLLHPDALRYLVRQLLEELSLVVWPAFVAVADGGELVWADDWADHVAIRRLDIARNLRVSDPDVVKATLPKVRCAYGKRSVVHTSGRNGWTLENKTTKSGCDLLYDKSAQLRAQGGPVPAGDPLFRFETRVEGDRLATLGLSRLSSVTHDSAWAALLRRWEATRWGSPLPSSSGVYEAIKHLPPKRQEGVLGFLHLDAIGRTSHLSPRRVRERRDEVSLLGLVPGLPVELQGPPDRCLDLEAGRLVPLAAVDEEAGSG